MKKKKILIIVLIVILILIIGVIGYFINLKMKAAIIRDISQKQEAFLERDTYYVKIIRNTDEDVITIEDYNKKDKTISFLTVTNKNSNETAKQIMYSDNEGSKIYIENGKKEMLEDKSIVYSPTPVNLMFSKTSDKDIIDYIISSDISIKSTTYNNKKCYIYKQNKLEHKPDAHFDMPEVYFYKETGLVAKYANLEYEYKFDDISDDIFTEIDLSQYTLKK